jgi:hypothetical protein
MIVFLVPKHCNNGWRGRGGKATNKQTPLPDQMMWVLSMQRHYRRLIYTCVCCLPDSHLQT